MNDSIIIRTHWPRSIREIQSNVVMLTPQAEEKLRLMKFGRYYSDPRVQAKLQERRDASRIGERVREGARKPRNQRHDLGNLIERTYLELAKRCEKPTAEQVHNAQEDYDKEEIIQEILVDNGEIHWKDWRGNDRNMSFLTLRNRLIKLRKHTGKSASSS